VSTELDCSVLTDGIVFGVMAIGDDVTGTIAAA